MKSCGHKESRQDCPMCVQAIKLAHKSEAYRQFYFGDQPIPKAQRCQYLGGPTGELIVCSDCPGAVRLKVFRCEIYARCTPSPNPETVCCAECPDFVVGE